MVRRFFAVNVKDKEMTATARLHKVTLQNGDIQQFIYRWGEMLSLMSRRPSDDDFMNLFVLQVEVHLAKQREFYVEYLFFYNRPVTDATRSHAVVLGWVRRKKETKNRKDALKDYLPGVSSAAYSEPHKGKTKDTGYIMTLCKN